MVLRPGLQGARSGARCANLEFLSTRQEREKQVHTEGTMTKYSRVQHEGMALLLTGTTQLRVDTPSQFPRGDMSLNLNTICIKIIRFLMLATNPSLFPTS